MPSTSTSQTSPGFMKSGGLRATPTPAGVPVTMTSPGSSVIDLLGHAYPPAQSLQQRTLGDVVVAEKQGIDGRVQAQGRVQQLGAQRHRRGAGPEQFQGGVMQARRLQGMAVAGGALHHAGIELACAKGNAPVPALHQMPRDGGSGLGLRKAHAGRTRLATQFHQVHAGDLAGLHQFTRSGAAVKTR